LSYEKGHFCLNLNPSNTPSTNPISSDHNGQTNLFDDQIVALTNSTHDIAQLANLIAKEAYSTASDRKCDTPFSVSSYFSWEGGKLDDITVLVSVVQKEEQERSSGEETD